MFFLFVASLWLVLGLWMIIFPEQMPERLQRIPYTDISLGWVCLLMFAWRMHTWTRWRRLEHDRQVRTQATPHRARPDLEYHPELDFTDPEGEPPPKEK